ncbi:MAG: hypothetical protein Q9168_000445 [Polycauliona sp. 1 TL-2023]
MANARPPGIDVLRLSDVPRPVPAFFPPTYLRDDRLSTTFGNRFIVGSAAAFLGGMSLGVAHGSKTAALRFRAENSHRFPTTSTGWYQYHKSKNYVCIFEGVKAGFRLGARLAGWAASFFYLEEVVDDFRNRRDFLSTAVASLTVSGIFSIKNRFNMTTAARTARTGLSAGLILGLLQDATALARGRRLHYVEYLKGNLREVA